MEDVATHFLSTAKTEFRKYKELADKAMTQLSDDQLHWQPNEESNSISLLIRHMRGNMLSRWTDFLHSDGEKPSRDRDSEFVDKEANRTELKAQWEEGWKCLFNALNELKPEDIQRDVMIRGQYLSVLEAISRQLMHYSYHVGQMVYLAKMLKNEQWQTLSVARNKSKEYNQSVPQGTRNYDSGQK